MAEKSFGVKEINLIGASGTPTIESPNNLNLNAVNVAISTNVSIGGTLSVTGNVSIGGTLTYEEVTNIDSVGFITARDGVLVGKGVSITAGGLNVSSGISTFAGNINANGNIVGDNSTNISGINSVTATSFFGDGSGLTGLSGGALSVDANNNFTAGTRAGEDLNSGAFSNLFIGYEAGKDTTGGDNNIALGSVALEENQGGNYNVAIGPSTLKQCVSGGANIAIGSGAGQKTTGSNNVFYGFEAGYNNTSGTNNVYLGKEAGSSTNSGSNNIVIGSGANPSSSAVSNEITLGDANIKHLRVPGIGVSFNNTGGTQLGIITATQLDISGDIDVTGVSTFTGVADFNNDIQVGRIDLSQGTGTKKIESSGSSIQATVTGSGNIILATNVSGGTSGDIKLQKGSGTDSLVVNGSGGVTVTGTLSATTFSGSGANLTNLPSPDPSNSDIQGMWTVGGSASGYTFTGPGQDGSEQNPDIFLVRGQRYRFVNSLAGGHPFEFRNFDNNADYTDGITGSQSGTQDFNVQHDAPSALKYRCTIHTSSMLGNIYIIGGKRGILTSETTLSGSSQSFDGIPSWATKIKIVFYRYSQDSNGDTYIKLRNGGGDITSGYNSYSVSDDGTASDAQSSSSFVLDTQSNAHWYGGEMVIEKVGNTRYVSSHSFMRSAATFSGGFQHYTGNGELEISSGGIVTGLKIETSTGNFDSSPYTNYITIYYE
jgi:hypothetical protein